MVILERQSLHQKVMRIQNNCVQHTVDDGGGDDDEEEGDNICITRSDSCHIGGIEESSLAVSGC